MTKTTDVFHELVLINNHKIVHRPSDGYINVTYLCVAGKRQYKHWACLKKTSAFLQALNSSIGIPTDELTKYKSGSNKERATWVHPQVAINIAQWISPEFDVQVSKWIYELAVTGTVTLGKEKTSTEILQLQKENTTFQKENTKLKNSLLRYRKKHNYHKFKKGPVLYLISDTEDCLCEDTCKRRKKFKIGIDGKDINRRLSEHRTTLPSTRLDYLIYTEDNDLLERSVLRKFKDNLHPFLNHEWIFDVEKDSIIESIKFISKYLGTTFTEESELNKYNDRIERIIKNHEKLPEESEDESSDEDKPIVINIIANQINNYQDYTGRKQVCRECKKLLPRTKHFFRPHNSGGFLHRCHNCVASKEYTKHSSPKTKKVIHLGARKVKNRPSVQELTKMIAETGYCAVARKYGVTDNAVRKWLH